MARSFSSVSEQYILFPSDTRLDLGESDFGVGFWFRGTTSPSTEALVARRNWGSGVGWQIGYQASGTKILASIDSTGSPSRALSATAPTLLNGNWHFICFTVDRDVGIFMCVDGVPLESTLGITAGHADPDLPLTIGASANDARHMDGVIAEVSIFNRVLTSAEQGIITKSFSAKFLRPKLYIPLIGNYSPEPELRTGLLGTLINGPIKADHKPLIRPQAQQTAYLKGVPESEGCCGFILVPPEYGVGGSIIKAR